jgi:Protein of unknown function (DUF3455)
MKSFITFKRLLPAAIVAAAAAASLVQVALAGPPPPSVPGPIQVLDGSKVFLIGHAVGVQIYTCNGSTWSSAVPRANLFDDHGKLIITHFAGPTWQAKDGSMVVGHAEASVTVDDTAIPGCGCPQLQRPPAGSGTPPTFNESQPPAATFPPPQTATRQRQEPWSRSPTPPTTTSGSRRTGHNAVRREQIVASA